MRLPDTFPPELGALEAYVEGASNALSAAQQPIWARVDDEVWRDAIAHHVAWRVCGRVLRVPDTRDPDAVLHVVAQAAGARVLDRKRYPRGGIEESARALKDEGRPVVVVIGRHELDSGAQGASPSLRELERLMDAWSGELRVLWLGGQSAPSSWNGKYLRRFELALPLTWWRRSFPIVASGDRLLSPTELSVVAALEALGRRDLLRRAMQARHVLDRGCSGATIREEELSSEASFALGCVASLRMPLRREELPSASGGSAALYDALTWETEEGVLAPQRLRAWARCLEDVDVTVHDRLAEAHKRLDGVSDPTRADTSVFHWLEKVHHLVRGSERSIEEWRRQRHLSPELYWDRGRQLSFARDYDGAAAVYAECLGEFPDDPYALHYRAFNLERAGRNREEAEGHYKRAIGEDRGNVWFHRRLVTFYLGLSRLAKAREAWKDALSAIQEDPSWARNEAWLGENLHLWVAEAWLANGDPHEARRVLDDLDSEIIKRSRDLSELAERIEHGVEVDALGDAVYPPSVPMGERWRVPRVLSTELADGRPLDAWWPGRVTTASKEGVSVVLADPTDRTLLDQDFTAEEWARAAGSPAARAEGFFELGRYGDVLRVARVPMTEADRRSVALPDGFYLGPRR